MTKVKVAPQIPEKLPKRVSKSAPEWFKTAMKVYKRKFLKNGKRKLQRGWRVSKAKQ